MKLQDYVKKMSFAMSLGGSGQINYILIPYRKMLAVSGKLSAMLFLLLLVSANLLIAAALVPAYIILLYTFWQFYQALKQFEFKALPVFAWLAVSNIPAALAAAWARAVLIGLIS